MQKSSLFWTVSIAFLLLISTPYVAGFFFSTDEMVFSGFLMNPIDGNSYLAKMQQGKLGFWKFRLPYTAEQGDGAFIYLYYLVLGHLSRLLRIDVTGLFHAARILNGLLLCLALRLFFDKHYQDRQVASWAFGFALFGSGLGYIAILWGKFTSDFWVAEIYPFLSAYTNPHFPLGLALLVFLLAVEQEKKLFLKSTLGLMLAVVQPFGAVILLLVKALYWTIRNLEQLRSWQTASDLGRSLGGLIVSSLPAGFFLIYQFWAIRTDPILSIWNQQNLTPPPGFGDLVLSLSPVFLVSLLGLMRTIRKRSGYLVVVWAAVCLVLTAVPWQLQRRFLTSIYIPLAGLAAYGLKSMTDVFHLRFKKLAAAVLVLSVPTNGIVVFAGFQAVRIQDPAVYYRAELNDFFSWVNRNSRPGDLFFVDSQLGNLLPAHTGRKVIYGHPFETIFAAETKRDLESFYSGQLSRENCLRLMTDHQPDYILVDKDVPKCLEQKDLVLSEISSWGPQRLFSIELEEAGNE